MYIAQDSPREGSDTETPRDPPPEDTEAPKILFSCYKNKITRCRPIVEPQ